MKRSTDMATIFGRSRRTLIAAGFAAGLLAAGYAGAAQVQVTLSGGQDVPAVTTKAAGTGSITVGDDKSVSGSVTTSGVVRTMAHIHQAAAGENGRSEEHTSDLPSLMRRPDAGLCLNQNKATTR